MAHEEDKDVPTRRVPLGEQGSPIGKPQYELWSAFAFLHWGLFHFVTKSQTNGSKLYFHITHRGTFTLRVQVGNQAENIDLENLYTNSRVS